MKYETLHGVKVPKIGFGTWRIAGEATPDPAFESTSRAALRSALNLGYTHFDTAEYYAGGYAEKLLGETIKEMGINRDELFITTKVSPSHLHFADVLHACENSLERLNMAYIDLYLIHWPMPRRGLFCETWRALERLFEETEPARVAVGMQLAVQFSRDRLQSQSTAGAGARPCGSGTTPPGQALQRT